MSQPSADSDSDRRNDSKLVDHRGDPFRQRVAWHERWETISAKTKIIVISFVAIVATTATFLANVEKIQNYFRPELALPSVPPITVKLSNRSMEVVRVAIRGDFLLWLPGANGLHMVGKYEFHTTDPPILTRLQ